MEFQGHPVFRHPGGGTCIWVDGDWFVPLDVGGEGYTCEQEHPCNRPHAEPKHEAQTPHPNTMIGRRNG